MCGETTILKIISFNYLLSERINQASLHMLGKILDFFLFTEQAPEVLKGTPYASFPLVAALLK